MLRPLRIKPKRKARVYIAERRKAAGFTQGELGKMLGVNANTISRWEVSGRQHRVPSSEVLAAIAEALGIHVSLLLLPLEADQTAARFDRLGPRDQRELLRFLSTIEQRRR